MYRILIIEDDDTIAKNIAVHFNRWNYETKQIVNFKNIMEEFLKFDPQLVLLDIGLPFYNGFYWCQEIRKISKVPILFLSSMNDNMNIVMAMNMGGDEFIDDNTLTVNVARLRKKLENAGMDNWIKTKKGIGYYLKKYERYDKNKRKTRETPTV